MPQISIIKKSDIIEAHRFDAEYFKPEYLEIEEKLKNSIAMESIAKSIICDPFGSTILDETYTSSGIEVIRPFNIKDGKIEDKNLVYISEEDVEQKNLKVFTLGDLFFSRVGDIKAGILTHKKSTISPNIIAVRLDKSKSNPYFLSSFCNTKYGFLQLLRKQKIVAQPTISTEAIRKILIPILPQSFQLQIEKTVKQAHQKQAQSKQLYQEAEQLLLEELGLVDYTPKHQLTFETSKKEVNQAKRFDAEYFQPKYEEINEKIEKYKGGFDVVGNQFKQNKTLAKKDRNFYNYIEIGSINTSNGEITPKLLDVADVPDNGKRKLFKDDLLISKVRPYRRAIAFVDFEKKNLLGSGAFTILKEKTNYKKEMLMLFLKTIFIKELLLRYNCGTSYPVIKDEDILNLKIPLVNPKTQARIAEKIQASHKLRKESKDLLEDAKRKVEEEIEKQ